MSHAAAPRDGLEGLFAGPQDVVGRLPTLRTVMQKTAGAWGELIGKISATAPHVELVGIESGPAEAMIKAAANKAAACVLEATKWNARLIVCADEGFVFAALEMLLGGDGSEPQPVLERPLSRVELRLAQLLFERFAGGLEAGFAPVAPTHFVVGPAGPQVSFEILGRMTVPIVAARFRMTVLGLGGELTLMMSQSVLNPMRNELSRPPTVETMHDPAWSQKIQSEVARANVDLVAVLDESMLTLADVAQFSVGQMLHLRATPDGVLCVECNGERLINCHIGKANGVYTLRVHDFIDQEQAFMQDILGG